MTDLILQIDHETRKQTSSIEQWNSVSIPTSEKKASINKFAAFLAKTAQEILDRSSHARTLFKNLYEAQIELQSLFLNNADAVEIASVKNTLKQIFEGMLVNSITARNSVMSFRKSTEALPRITGQFNR